MQMTNRMHTFVMCVVTIASVIFWAWRLHPVVPTISDASEYIALAQNLRVHGTYGFGNPPVPSAFREPGYPVLLALIFMCAGGVSIVGLLIAQTILLCCTLMLFNRLLERLWPKEFAASQLRAALPILFALSPIFAQYAGLFLSETLQVFLLLAALVATLEAFERGGRWGIIAGACWGGLILTRMTWLFVPFILALVFFWRTRRMRTALCLCLIPAVMMGAWMTRNALVLGSVLPASRGGAEAYVRADKVIHLPEIRASYARMTLFGSAFEIRRDPTFEPRRVDGYGEYYATVETMQRSGMSESAIDTTLGQQALDALRRHPILYAFDGLFEIWKLLTPLAFMGPTTYTFSGTALAEPFWPYATALICLRLWTVLKIVLVIWGGVILWRRNVFGWAVALIVGYFVGIHMFFDAIPRYAIPLRPLILLMGALACYDGVRRFWRRKSP